MRLTQVKAAKRYTLELEFDDGVCGVVDLGDLAGKGVFKAWEEAGAFESVEIGSGGEVNWPCGVDLCADALYLRLTGKSVEDIFPSVRAGSRVEL
ncbi:MAG: DUF2442 domain-containing protein [Deltaproteobacteria bacterium]|nr:DUF2442 domain-containing protein [Deltaproteobacteria bacterium]